MFVQSKPMAPALMHAEHLPDKAVNWQTRKWWKARRLKSGQLWIWLMRSAHNQVTLSSNPRLST